MRKPDVRLLRNKASAIARFDLLKAICDKPESFVDNDELLKALQTQKALAAFDWPGRNIAKASLNTLKAVSEGAIPGGWEAMDQARDKALWRLLGVKSEEKSSKITKMGLMDRLDAQNDELDVVKQKIVALSSELIFAIDEIGHIASVANESVRMRRTQELQSRLRAQFQRFRPGVAG